MTRKLKVVYEGGVLRPLEPLDGLRERQVLAIAFDVDVVASEPGEGQGRTIQLGGVLKDHNMGDISSDLKEVRTRAWTHLETELTDG